MLKLGLIHAVFNQWEYDKTSVTEQYIQLGENTLLKPINKSLCILTCTQNAKKLHCSHLVVTIVVRFQSLETD